MNLESKALKSRYRSLCTEVEETRDKNGRVVSKTRVRSYGSPSLKDWATATEAGKRWRERKRRGR